MIHRGLLGQESARVEHVEHMPVVGPDTDAFEQATQAVLSTIPQRLDNPRRAPISEAEISALARSQRHAGLAAILSLLRAKSPVTWLFTGDNVIQGTGSTDGRRSCVEIFAERVRGELRRAGDVVINTGVSGDTAPQLLSTLKRRVSRYHPDVVVISLGINDCKAGLAGRDAFRSTMRELLDRIRTGGSIPLVLLPHPIYTPATRNRSDLREYVEILRQEIVRDEVPCVDHWQDWLQNWPEPNATRSRLSDGRIQLNAAAHQHLAGLIFKTLQIFDERSEACKETKN